jgi:hypothetical protein
MPIGVCMFLGVCMKLKPGYLKEFVELCRPMENRGLKVFPISLREAIKKLVNTKYELVLDLKEYNPNLKI